jgi:hypothetical protein
LGGVSIDWPKTESNNLVPWYLVVWRIPFFLILTLLRFLCFLVALLGWGYRAARQIWNDTK